jgi:hypothetical protein
LIRIYSNESSILVNHVKNILDNEGIETLIKNEAIQGIGIIEFGMCWPELWLTDEKQAEKAQSLIDTILSDDEKTAENWICPSCSETNEAAFNLCWKCSQPIAVS